VQGWPNIPRIQEPGSILTVVSDHPADATNHGLTSRSLFNTNIAQSGCRWLSLVFFDPANLEVRGWNSAINVNSSF
jgi:hypothetical protein